MGNEYQPKCGDALRMDSKGRHGLFHLWINVWMAGTLYDPSLTCTIAERLRDEQLIIKRYTDKASFTFTCDECICVSVCLSDRISPEPHARSVPLEFFVHAANVRRLVLPGMFTIGRIAYCREGIFFPIDNAL